MSDGIEGKVALVTGGARGIGWEIACRLSSRGARVVVGDVRFDAPDPPRPGAEATTIRRLELDVGDDGSVERAVASVLDDYGTISLLVNNAGITRDNLLLRMKKEEWDAVISVNLGGTFRMCRAVAPAMVRARYGRIVNVSSVIAGLGNAGQVNYAASKAGVEGLTRTLARELASRNITVNCVAPGFIDTAMTRALSEEARARLLDLVPAKRLGTPSDVAHAVLFLLADETSYVTGHTLHVNGGMHM